MKVYMLNKDQQWENQGMTSSYVELLKGMSLLVRFDKMWSTRKGNDKPLQHFCLENLNEEYDSMNKIGCFLKFYFIDSTLLLNLRLEGLVIKIF